MQQSNIPLAALFVLRRNDRLVLKFSPPGNDMPLVRTMALNETVKEDVGRINLETFVSIESEVFRHMVAEFRGYIVCVLPTPSSVMFSIEVKELILDKAKGECIIEGVAEEVQTEFLIPLYPWHIFYNMTFHSKRIWLFKTFDKSTLIIAPVGLYAQYSIFFPLG
ncbi:uncharacterized protein LOC111499328 [Cucurbita maxima]|uniref:Uncharacterized protein LOC111499328 n=1 Tax=Cucurbita maxima TaxID=3661 RepID=A0A6J1L5L4_CUCMA|nr:uncharacterized protein LOC111499328 [Cucurbita maxima]